MAKSLLSRFEAKFIPEPNSGCWLWAAHCSKRDGYGTMRAYTGTGGMRKAHRLSYELHVGPIPDGMELDHLCRVRCCVNPQHLEPVTHDENIKRGFTAAIVRERQAARTRCPHGHELTEANTYVHGHNHRMCRICLRQNSAAYRLRKRECSIS